VEVISRKKLLDKLDDVGYNRDIEISKKIWMEAKDELKTSKSILGLPSLFRVEEPIFRDTEPTKSVELKDYSSRTDFEPDYVAELEHFNPQHHKILHMLVDVPIWTLKNRLLNRGPKTKNTE